jgi:hypothetical protein
MEPNTGEITNDEQFDYLESSSRLMLWFAREWHKKRPDEDFESVIRNRTDLYRMTTFNSGGLDSPVGGYPEAWLQILNKFLKIHNETKGEPDSAGFEQKCSEILRPYWMGRVERDVKGQADGTLVAGYQCGSLRYELAPDKNNPKRIIFHIANACYPGSLFDDRLYLPACLLVLTTQCAAKFGVTEIGTGTWLNSHPKWLEFFPKEWLKHMGASNDDIRWHYGFWGQFITSRRTFNHKLGAKFRQSGKMPYALRSSWCSISSLRKHIETTYF